MYLFFKQGIRVGVSMISNRSAKDHYDPGKKSVYIPYLDANNLYGAAMCEPYLPRLSMAC